MNKFKIFLNLVIITVLFFITNLPVLAAGMEVSCGPGGCTLSTSDPLFSETGIYPSWSITKSVKAKNTYPEDRHFAVSVEGTTFSDSTPPLSEVLTITITEQESSTVVYGPKTIKEWKDSGFTVLSTIPAGGERNYDLTVALGDVADDYQGKTLGFDLNLGFESLPPPPPPPGIVGGVTTVARGIGGVLGGILEGLEEKIEGEEAPLLEEEGVVSGAGVVACQDPFWWPLAILLQLNATLLIHRQIKEGRPFLTAQVTTAVVAVVLLAKFFCLWWLPLIGAAVGAVAVYLGLRRVAT